MAWDQADARVAAALPIVAAQQGGGWLPIDSAPKDGSLFLAVARLGQRNQWISQCKWVGPDKRHPTAKLDWFMGVDGWPQPTHWQPLPAPPSPTALARSRAISPLLAFSPIVEKRIFGEHPELSRT